MIGDTTRRDSRMSNVSRLSIDSFAALDQGIVGKQQLFTKMAFYKVSVHSPACQWSEHSKLQPDSVATLTNYT
jgi:hypothetical protein